MSDIWFGLLSVGMVLLGGVFAYVSVRFIRNEATAKYASDVEAAHDAQGDRKLLAFSVIFILLGGFMTVNAYQDSSFYYLFHPHQRDILSLTENLKGEVMNAQVALSEGSKLKSGAAHVAGQVAGSNIVVQAGSDGEFIVTAWLPDLGSSANSVVYRSATGQFILQGSYESFGGTPYGHGYTLASQGG